jgi:hypothetical protein
MTISIGKSTHARTQDRQCSPIIVLSKDSLHSRFGHSKWPMSPWSPWSHRPIVVVVVCLGVIGTERGANEKGLAPLHTATTKPCG